MLAQPEGGEAIVRAKWHQLVDLLAQRPDSAGGPQVDQALAYIQSQRAYIPVEQRRRIAASFVGRISPELDRILKDEEEKATPEPAAPWPIPAPASPEPALSPAAAKSEAHIRDLLARIEAVRKRKHEADAPPQGPLKSFRWETGADGVLLWVDGAPREPLVGQSIASAAAPGEFGVDGQAVGAFKQRSPFRDARFTVAGEGPASGDWRLSGVPFFDAAQGHFVGYRGSARRPRLDEVAAPVAPLAARAEGMFGTKMEPDALRQLVHELRTPLNAIMGFAEMIDRQFLGPAAENYRARAAAIREEAARLLSSVDDLDTAARIETHRLPLDESAVDAVVLLFCLYDDYERVATQRNATLQIDFAPDLPPAKIEASAAERMFARLLAATIGLAGEGETLLANLACENTAKGPMLCLSIARPRAISGLFEAELLDPGYTPEGDWPEAPSLGLGFALRLVRSLAEAVGGSLDIGPDRFNLYLPPLLPANGSASRSG